MTQAPDHKNQSPNISSLQNKVQPLKRRKQITLICIISGVALLIGCETYFKTYNSSQISRISYFFQSLLKVGIATATFFYVDANIQQARRTSEDSQVDLKKAIGEFSESLNSKIEKIPSKEDFKNEISTVRGEFLPLKQEVQKVGEVQRLLWAAAEPTQSGIKKLEVELQSLKNKIGNDQLGQSHQVGIQRFEIEFSQLKREIEQTSNPILQSAFQRMEAEFAHLKQEVGPGTSSQDLQSTIRSLQAEFRTLLQDQYHSLNDAIQKVIQEFKAEFNYERETRESELQKQAEESDNLHAELKELKEKGSLSWRDLSRAQLAKIDLDSADLRSSNLYEANLSGAILNNTVLREANLGKANLYGAKLNKSDLSGANLSEANLSGKETELKGARLVKAHLNAASLSKANLESANLKEANLVKAYLPNAKLHEADLSRAKLHDVILTNAELTDAKLYEADLNSSDLSGAILIKAKLKGATLSDVDLTDADLTEADLTDTNLTDADLTRADLTRVIFNEGTNFTGANLTNAKFDEKLKEHIDKKKWIKNYQKGAPGSPG